jgi:hypothetical protein
MPPAELEELVRFLMEKRSTFVVFHEFSLLYAMLDQPAPQPLLWFHEGLTYRGNDPKLDRWIARSLAENNVDLLIFEHGSWVQIPVNLTDDFPQTGQFVAQNFVHTRTIGSFEIHERLSKEPPR